MRQTTAGRKKMRRGLDSIHSVALAYALPSHARPVAYLSILEQRAADIDARREYERELKEER
jgi:hypothetical protein